MVLRSMASMTALNVAKAAASLFISILIASRVAPAEFGLIAFAIPLTAFILLVTDLGLSSAIVRHPALDTHQAGSAVGLMGIAGLLGGLLMASVAMPVEKALGLAGVAPVLLGFSAVTACSIWATAPRALLERQLAYPQIARVEATALLAAVAVFCGGVALSFGILALVAFHVVLQALRAAAFGWLARPLFVLGFDVARIAALARIGGWVFVTNLLSYSARNLDRLLIAGVLGAASLGLYGLAYQFMTIPLVLIAWPVSGVLLSTLARMQKDSPDKAGVVCAVVTGTATFVLPLMTFFVFGLRAPIEHFYAGQWAGLAEMIAMLAPVGAVQAIAVYHSAVLVEKGAVRLNFGLGLLNGLGLSAVFLCTVWLGLPVLIASYAVAAVGVSVVMIWFMCREAGISAGSFFKCLVPGVAASLLGVAAVGLTTGFVSLSVSSWLLGAAIYAAAVGLVFVLQRGRLLASVQALAGARVMLAVRP
jgi:O-antigen/teichoic acid export membrane protein